MTNGPVAIVTGGTRGIGRAVCERLLADGWSVMATYLSDDEGAARFAETSDRLAVRRSDVGVSSDCAAAVEAVLECFGQLDHLVSAAAISRDAPALDLIDEDWDAVLATNLTGAFRIARAAMAPITASPRGRIVTLSSVAGGMGNPGQVAYASAKAGLIGLTRTLAREVAASGTTVNLVVPGPTAGTGMTAEASPAFVRAIERKIPLGRLARPEEVAHAVRWLLDDLSSFVTGSTVTVDGGLSM